MKIQILVTRLLVIFFLICSISPALALQRDPVTLSASETDLLSYKESEKEGITDSYDSESQSVINNFQLFYLYDSMMIYKNMKLGGAILSILGGTVLATGMGFDALFAIYWWALIPGLISTIGGGIMLLIGIPVTVFAYYGFSQKKEQYKVLTGVDFISISEYNFKGLSFSCSF